MLQLATRQIKVWKASHSRIARVELRAFSLNKRKRMSFPSLAILLPSLIKRWLRSLRSSSPNMPLYSKQSLDPLWLLLSSTFRRYVKWLDTLCLIAVKKSFRSTMRWNYCLPSSGMHRNIARFWSCTTSLISLRARINSTTRLLFRLWRREE